MRRHLESAQLEQPEPAAAAVGAVELVDAELGAVRVAGEVGQQVPQRAVDEPRRGFLVQLARRVGEPPDLLQRDLHLVDRLGPALVEARRLAGRSDEPPREQVRQARMPLPVGDQAREQIGAAQQRRIDRLRPAERDVVAAAGAGVQSVEVELLRREAALARLFVQRHGEVAQVGPRRGRLHVHLDHAGVGRDDELGQARVRRRTVALEHEPAARAARAAFSMTMSRSQ